MVNGDFSEGNTGFVTNYVYVDQTDFVNGGIYMIGLTPTIMHPMYCNISDHTTGTAPHNMMIISNSRAGAQDVMWQQDVTVKPNTRYTVSVSAASMIDVPFSIAISINDVQVAKEFLPSDQHTCHWLRLVSDWSSESATTARIKIYSNDLRSTAFALDDIRLFITGSESVRKLSPEQRDDNDPLYEDAPRIAEMKPASSPTHNAPPSTTSHTTTTNHESRSMPGEDGNLIINGDFSEGEYGFKSDYGSSAPISTPSSFKILGNPKNKSNSYVGMHDHTSGYGPMMVIDGSMKGSEEVAWRQNVPVTANTTYTFSISAATIWEKPGPEPAVLNVNINGAVIISEKLPDSDSVGQWQQYEVSWNSGTHTTAAIAISSTARGSKDGSGNDFALDDIRLIKTK